MAKELIEVGRIDQDGAIRFGEKLAASHLFKTLFAEGMALVEKTAAYLDGGGREEARRLPREPALAYASESMRLTTRLMQIASWLLVQRAVNEGEMTQAEAASDHQRTRLAWETTRRPDNGVAGLPGGLLALNAASLRLQERIVHLDRLISVDTATPAPSPIEDQISKLRAAFC